MYRKISVERRKNENETRKPAQHENADVVDSTTFFPLFPHPENLNFTEISSFADDISIFSFRKFSERANVCREAAKDVGRLPIQLRGRLLSYKEAEKEKQESRQ